MVTSTPSGEVEVPTGNGIATGGRSVRSGKLLNAALLVILALGIITRFLNIGAQGIMIDETWVVPTTNFHFESDDIFPKLFKEEAFRNLPVRAQQMIRALYDLHPLVQVAAIRAASDVHPPLFFFLNYYTGRWFGYRMEVVRAPAAIYFITALLLVLHILKREGERPQRVVAILLFVALCPFALFLSNYARPYTLLLLLGVWSSDLAYRAVQNNFRTRTTVAFALVSTAVMYTHYYGILLALAQGLYLVVESAIGKNLRKRIRAIAITEAAVALLYLPWAFALLFQIRMRYGRLEGKEVFSSFDLRAVADLLLHFGLGYSYSTVVSPVNIAGTAIMVFLCGIGVTHLWRNRHQPLSRFWLFFLLVPLAEILILNAMKPVFVPRNCVIILIPYLATCGYGLAAMRNSWARTGASVVVTVVGGYFVLGGLTRGNMGPDGYIEDWRSIAAYIEKAPVQQPVYVYHPSYRDALYYYIPDSSIVLGLREELSQAGPADGAFTLVLVNHQKAPIEDKLKELGFLFDRGHTWEFRYRAAGIFVYDVKARGAAGPTSPFPGPGSGKPTL